LHPQHITVVFPDTLQLRRDPGTIAALMLIFPTFALMCMQVVIKLTQTEPEQLRSGIIEASNDVLQATGWVLTSGADQV
jgi:uncharacterized membrane protein (GlpM family)